MLSISFALSPFGCWVKEGKKKEENKKWTFVFDVCDGTQKKDDVGGIRNKKEISDEKI